MGTRRPKTWRVLDAYGFSPNRDLIQQLLNLNHLVAARLENGEDVAARGAPPDYPNPERLLTDDCIRP